MGIGLSGCSGRRVRLVFLRREVIGFVVGLYVGFDEEVCVKDVFYIYRI